jgi:hypothetical protein
VNIVRDDLKRLRLPIALAVISVVLGAVCLIASGNYLDAARQARAAARQGRLAAQERVSKVSEEERDIRENLTYYEQMRAHGMVGVQNRLDWIETIARIKNTRKLYEIKYSIEAQKPLDYPGIVPVQNAEFVVSRMKLDMMLLHEDDLLGFLDDLRQEGKAHVTVKRCMVERLGTVTALQPRLRAECLVDLVSLKSPGPA